MARRNRANKAQRRAEKRKRQAVNRAERVGATPETLAKMQRDGLQDLLTLGPDNSGIDARQHEHLLEIEKGWLLVTAPAGLAMSSMEPRTSPSSGEMTDGQSDLYDRYCQWSTEFFKRTLTQGYLIAEWVHGRYSYDPMAAEKLRQAANLWDKLKRDRGNAQ